MRMKEKEIENVGLAYKSPKVNVIEVAPQGCIATSVTGSTEGYSDYDYQNEGFDERNQGDF